MVLFHFVFYCWLVSEVVKFADIKLKMMKNNSKSEETPERRFQTY